MCNTCDEFYPGEPIEFETLDELFKHDIHVPGKKLCFINFKVAIKNYFSADIKFICLSRSFLTHRVDVNCDKRLISYYDGEIKKGLKKIVRKPWHFISLFSLFPIPQFLSHVLIALTHINPTKVFLPIFGLLLAAFILYIAISLAVVGEIDPFGLLKERPAVEEEININWAGMRIYAQIFLGYIVWEIFRSGLFPTRIVALGKKRNAYKDILLSRKKLWKSKYGIAAILTIIMFIASNVEKLPY